LHPTTLIHQLLGQAMFNSLKTHDSQQNPTSP
jgi:phospholipase/lecithinase/hemolysin